MDRLNNMPLNRSQMNALIMDYMVAEGFKEAANSFKTEAGIEMARIAGEPENPELLDERIRVRSAIEEGHITEAIKLLNEYYPELLDGNRVLYFKLQLQQLIELIRNQQVDDALAFAQDQLSVDEDFLQLQELERTLALLAFDSPETSPYADLLQLAHRQQLASEVNESILKEQSGSNDDSKPQLVTLIKLLMWTQGELEKKKVKFPKMTDLATATIIGNNE